MQQAWEFFRAGGWAMWPLLVLSLAGTATVAYCLLALRRTAIAPPALARVADLLSRPEDIPAALRHCREDGGPFAGVLRTVLENRHRPRAEAEALAEAAGRRAVHALSVAPLVLEAVAAVGPLLGLLGTVSGMYRMMISIAREGSNDLGTISGSIGEALITTLAGLVIGIPAYLTAQWAHRRVEALALGMEERAAAVAARLRDGAGGP